MDPFSAIIAIVLIFQILKKGPEVVADMAQAAKESWDNAAHQARIKKLAAAGVAPATRGGALGRYIGNLVREARLDAEARHIAKAAAQVAAGKQPSRFGQRVAAAVAGWRGQNTNTSGTFVHPPNVRPPTAPAGAADPTPTPDPVAPAGPTFTVPVDEATAPPEPTPVYQATAGTAHPDDTGGWGGAGDRTPILVGAAVVGPALAIGAGHGTQTTPSSPMPVAPSSGGLALTATAVPAPSTAPAIEGTTHMSSGTVEVTGVSSGAAAAQRLASDIQAATDAFAAQLAAFQRRIIEMAAQGHGQVGLGGHSNAIQGLAQANEAMAAARGQVSTMTAEVIPLVHAVRRAYLAIH